MMPGAADVKLGEIRSNANEDDVKDLGAAAVSYVSSATSPMAAYSLNVGAYMVTVTFGF